VAECWQWVCTNVLDHDLLGVVDLLLDGRQAIDRWIVHEEVLHIERSGEQTRESREEGTARRVGGRQCLSGSVQYHLVREHGRKVVVHGEGVGALDLRRREHRHEAITNVLEEGERVATRVGLFAHDQERQALRHNVVEGISARTNERTNERVHER